MEIINLGWSPCIQNSLCLSSTMQPSYAFYILLSIHLIYLPVSLWFEVRQRTLEDVGQ